MTQISCFGFVDDHKDGIFDKDLSYWDNNFSNETALCRTSDGGMCRINEFRRVCTTEGKVGSVRCRIYGTKASYEEQPNARAWITHDKTITDLSAELDCGKVPLPDSWNEDNKEGVQDDFISGLSSVHDSARLPAEFAGLYSGHSGSHHFLVDDFVKAWAEEKLPPVHVWRAAIYCAPGVVAHQSALRVGEMLPVPDLGWPRSDAALLDVWMRNGSRNRELPNYSTGIPNRAGDF